MSPADFSGGRLLMTCCMVGTGLAPSRAAEPSCERTLRASRTGAPCGARGTAAAACCCCSDAGGSRASQGAALRLVAGPCAATVGVAIRGKQEAGADAECTCGPIGEGAPGSVGAIGGCSRPAGQLACVRPNTPAMKPGGCGGCIAMVCGAGMHDATAGFVVTARPGGASSVACGRAGARAPKCSGVCDGMCGGMCGMAAGARTDACRTPSNRGTWRSAGPSSARAVCHVRIGIIGCALCARTVPVPCAAGWSPAPGRVEHAVGVHVSTESAAAAAQAAGAAEAATAKAAAGAAAAGATAVVPLANSVVAVRSLAVTRTGTAPEPSSADVGVGATAAAVPLSAGAAAPAAAEEWAELDWGSRTHEAQMTPPPIRRVKWPGAPQQTQGIGETMYPAIPPKFLKRCFRTDDVLRRDVEAEEPAAGLRAADPVRRTHA